MSARKSLPTVRYLEECLLWNPANGRLFWKVRPRKHFSSDRDWKWWNKIHAGVEAFCSVSTSKKYFYGVIDRKIYLTHRVIWKLAVRREPPKILDHKDRDGFNNIFSNLRKATNGQNRINSKSVGISYDVKAKRWRAFVGAQRGRLRYLSFRSRSEALVARSKTVARCYGEFAP
jgi:hypothetical protein